MASKRSAGVMDRRSVLEGVRLYLITPCWFVEDGGVALTSVLGAGVGMVQLRDKLAEAKGLLAAAEVVRRVVAAKDALFIVNDRVDLAIASGADGVHLGQGDLPVAEARRQVGPDLLIGLSTHTSEQVLGVPDEVDYIGVGPVSATPTKEGREPVGLELVTFAAANATVPFFAIGGIDRYNAASVVGAGASRISVLRAITDDPDPALAARLLLEALSG